jgi:hypothetical protein
VVSICDQILRVREIYRFSKVLASVAAFFFSV